MIRIGILGDIGSGKSFVASNFGYPVFNADKEVIKLYKLDKKLYFNLKKKLPEYIFSFPINKSEISKAIISRPENLKKIVKIVHKEVRKKMNFFIVKGNLLTQIYKLKRYPISHFCTYKKKAEGLRYVGNLL